MRQKVDIPTQCHLSSIRRHQIRIKVYLILWNSDMNGKVRQNVLQVSMIRNDFDTRVWYIAANTDTAKDHTCQCIHCKVSLYTAICLYNTRHDTTRHSTSCCSQGRISLTIRWKQKSQNIDWAVERNTKPSVQANTTQCKTAFVNDDTTNHTKVGTEIAALQKGLATGHNTQPIECDVLQYSNSQPCYGITVNHVLYVQCKASRDVEWEV